MKLTESTYLALRDDIFNARYKPNELITERQIAEKYGVSKLTAGEVLHRLCFEGHLTSYPRSGYMVTTLTPKEIGQIERIRFAMESLVLETICESVSDEDIQGMYRYIVDAPEKDEHFTATNTKFHLALAQLSQDRFLIKHVQDLLGSLSRVEQSISDINKKTWQDEHVAILEALSRRDLEAAKQHLKVDLDQVN